MDIEVKVGGCAHTGGFFKYRHYKDGHEEGEILLSNPICTDCGNHGQLTLQNYLDILEHEYVELSCARINFHDKGPRWNAKGFNKAYWRMWESINEAQTEH